jgi:hypothetical protein
MTYDKKDFFQEAPLRLPINMVCLEHTKEKKTMTHAEAVKMVRGKRNADRRKVGNNTYAEILSDGTVGIKLHNTYVVKIHEDGTYTLNSGGWQTLTTKDRINQYSPRKVYQRNFQWYVEIVGSTGCTNLFPFMEGMVIS